jgi:hypothetical protein
MKNLPRNLPHLPLLVVCLPIQPEDDPNDDPFPQDNHSSGYPNNTNDDAGSYCLFIPDSAINNDGGLSDGEEDELPMFETESVSSCADDYDIHMFAYYHTWCC